MHRRPSRVSHVHIAGIDIEWTSKDIKNIRLRVVPPDGTVKLSVPFGTDVDRVRAFVLEQRDWVLKAQARLRLAPKPTDPLVDGGRARLWGAWHEVHVVEGPRPDVRVVDGRIVITVPEGGDRVAALDTLYRRELERVLPGLLETWVERTERGPTKVQLRRMKTRWGSCTKTTGAMRLNLRLAEYPPEALEYVLVHELTHLWESNHGPNFYALLGGWLPDWRRRRMLLRRPA